MTNNNDFEILNRLEESYPEAKCELNFTTPFELLVAVVLSAQCTDKRVNMVTNNLFKVANTPDAFNDMDILELEGYIHSCGFYRNKAKSIKSLSKDIVENYNGDVPNNIQELTKLAGVGNKTASVVYSVAFHGEALPVDTHVFRVSHRLGLSNANTPDKVMEELKGKFPSNKWYTLHHTMIFHGRYTCKSQNPECNNCQLYEFCRYEKKDK